MYLFLFVLSGERWDGRDERVYFRQYLPLLGLVVGKDSFRGEGHRLGDEEVVNDVLRENRARSAADMNVLRREGERRVRMWVGGGISEKSIMVRLSCRDFFWSSTREFNREIKNAEMEMNSARKEIVRVSEKSQQERS